MPKIRKRTSNRQNTRDRAKIVKKVSEFKKKSKRDTKRNVTWKSKKKADPGVPNSFHLKDQVLAEMANEKRQAEADRLARRGGKAKATEEDEEEENPGIISVPAAVLTATAPVKGAAAAGKAAQTNGEEDADVPQLVDTHLSTLQDVIDRADVVLQVVDARDIQGGRSAFVEGMIRDASGNHGLIVNKADLVPRETLAAWLPHLPAQTFLFSSPPAAPSIGSSSKSKAPAPAPLPMLGRKELLAAFGTWSAQKASAASTSSTPADELVVAFMGLPSVGKSSVINALLPSSRVKQAVASAVPSGAAAKHPEPTTKVPTELRVQVGDAFVRVIDTPGWEYAEDDVEDDEEDEEDEVAEDEAEVAEEEDAEMDDDEEEDEAGGQLFDEDKAAELDALEERVAGDLLRRNLGRVERVKDIFPLANYIISRSNAQDLMTCYNVPFFQDGDVETFLTSLARSIGRVRKHGDADLEAAARHLVRDWSHNTFPYYTAPPKAASTNGEPEASDRPDMTKVLEGCRTKRELKALAKGLVRFKGGDVDAREVILDDDYTAMNAPSDDEDEDELDAMHTLGDEDEDDEEDDEDDDDEEGSDVLEFDLVDGEELELEDGPEPSSPSSLDEDEQDSDDDEDEESEGEEEVVQPVSRANKRKANDSPVAKAKKQKRVSFGGKSDNGKVAAKLARLPAPANDAPAPSSILKPSKAKSAAAAAVKAEKPKAVKAAKKAEVAKPAPAAPKPAAAAAPAKAGKGKKAAAAPAGAEEAYDFSKHF